MLLDVYRTGQTLPQTNHLTHTHAQLIKDVGRPINILTGTELAGRRGRLNEQPCLSVCVCVCVCVRVRTWTSIQMGTVIGLNNGNLMIVCSNNG